MGDGWNLPLLLWRYWKNSVVAIGTVAVVLAGLQTASDLKKGLRSLSESCSLIPSLFTALRITLASRSLASGEEISSRSLLKLRKRLRGGGAAAFFYITNQASVKLRDQPKYSPCFSCFAGIYRVEARAFLFFRRLIRGGGKVSRIFHKIFWKNYCIFRGFLL